MDLCQYDDDEPYGIKHIKNIPYEGGLVQFECVSDTESFCSWFNGDYCPDPEMEELLGSLTSAAKERMKL